MYFGDPRRRGLPTILPTVRFDGAAIESAAVKQTLTETKRLDTIPKYLKRCKEKYQKNLLRLSFKPDLANCRRLTVVALSNYTIHRRDRNWFDNDKREKGGVAIYVRKNVKVKSVSRSELFESISLEIELPSGHQMLMCGIYHQIGRAHV